MPAWFTTEIKPSVSKYSLSPFANFPTFHDSFSQSYNLQVTIQARVLQWLVRRCRTTGPPPRLCQFTRMKRLKTMGRVCHWETTTELSHEQSWAGQQALWKIQNRLLLRKKTEEEELLTPRTLHRTTSTTHPCYLCFQPSILCKANKTTSITFILNSSEIKS